MPDPILPILPSLNALTPIPLTRDPVSGSKVHLLPMPCFSSMIAPTAATAHTTLFKTKAGQNHVSLQLLGKTQNTGNERNGHHRSKMEGSALGTAFPGAAAQARNCRMM